MPNDVDKKALVEARKDITVSSSHFISQEGAKHFGYPTFWQSNGKGGHIAVVRYEGEYYLTQPTIKPFPDPIPYGSSSRKS